MSHIHEAEDYRFPNRIPWIVLIIATILVVGGWQFWRIRQSKAGPEHHDGGLVNSSTVMQPSGVTNTAPSVAVEPARTVATMPVSSSPQNSGPIITPSNILVRVALAADLESKGDFSGARKELHDLLLVSSLDPIVRRQVEDQLGRVQMHLALTPAPMPEKVDYVVKAGDSIDKISKKHGVPSELVIVGNGLKNPNVIKQGDHLRILTGKFSIVVEKKNNTLLLLFNDRFFKRYNVGTGKFGKTPIGTFSITDRIPEPPWWKDNKVVPFGDKENILGTRWMAIKASGDTPPVQGYGIHGTWDDASIGKAESAGCIRMHNADVEELFNLVPLGTVVTIVE